jgi:hypothetical protein
MKTILKILVLIMIAATLLTACQTTGIAAPIQPCLDNPRYCPCIWQPLAGGRISVCIPIEPVVSNILTGIDPRICPPWNPANHIQMPDPCIGPPIQSPYPVN